MAIIKAEHIFMRFHLSADRITSMKEYIVKLITGKLRYKDFWALQDVSFSIEPGDVLGIIGHNGAGKSTLLKVISGIMKPTEGTVEVHGNVVPMLELGSGFDYDMTGRENIYLNGAILGYSKAFLESKCQEIIEFSELGEFIEEPLRNYSSGMMMRLAFSIATVVQPEVLIVDEILAVGDADFQEKSKKRMMELMDGGTTVLMVSHTISQIRELCNKVLWIEHGRVCNFGEAKEICDAYEGLLSPDVPENAGIGRQKEHIRRISMYDDDWFPPEGAYKIRTGEEGVITGILYCPFRDLTGTEAVTLSLNRSDKIITLPITREYTEFRLCGTPNSVVTVSVNSNFWRYSGEDKRQLSVLLTDTNGQ